MRGRRGEHHEKNKRCCFCLRLLLFVPCSPAAAKRQEVSSSVRGNMQGFTIIILMKCIMSSKNQKMEILHILLLDTD